MSIFSNPFKKLESLSALAAKLPIKKALRKGTKAAAIVSSLVLAGRLGHTLIKKTGEKVDESVAEGKNNALSEIRTTVNKNLEKFIFECVLRWILYISLIMLAYLVSKAFNLRKDILVAFVILGIYSFYLIKFSRAFSWYISFCKANGWMFNPLRIIRAYLHKAVLDRVQREIDGLSLLDRLAMNFFGPSSDKIAEDITRRSLQSNELMREAMTRIGMMLCGWIIYALIYEKLFLFVTGIDFNAVWEPLIWPFHILVKILAAK